MSSPSEAPAAIRLLLARIGALVEAEDRAQAARDLAATLGCHNLLIFTRDPELGVRLPAPGFPQTLPDGGRWAAFLRECAPPGVSRSRQTFPGSPEPEEVVAVTAEDGAVLVLSGDGADAAGLELAHLLLPLVSAAFRGQQAARAAQAQAAVAERAARDAESLARALDETRRDLQDALVEAEQALRTREEFLTVASHELRTPLTVLRLQVQMLQRAARHLSDSDPFARQTEILAGRMDRSLRRLATLTNDLLDVSRIAAGRLELRQEPMDLCDLAREVVDRFQGEAARHDCTLGLECGDAVEGRWDPSRLDQVLTNLIANALEYARGTAVRVRVESDPGCARIEVRDGGPGIAPEDQERVFHRFERAQAREDGGGMGLGLHICKQIVEAHQGRIALESVDGAGAAFTVELPIA